MKISFLKSDNTLQKKLAVINEAVKNLEPCEFQYAMNDLMSDFPLNEDISIPEEQIQEKLINDEDFYKSIELKPVKNGKIVIDRKISKLTLTLLGGISSGNYNIQWVDKFFYFDVRGFIFIPRTVYFTQAVQAHLQNKPYIQFEKKQMEFGSFQGVGYRDFKMSNKEIDEKLIRIIDIFIKKSSHPLTIGIAGPTAAGKTEITEYIQKTVLNQGKTDRSIEIDNFFIDRDYRESKGIGSMEKESLHYKLFINSLLQLKKGEPCEIPEYNQLTGDSSHTIDEKLKEGKNSITINPADIIYVEGNFPFLFSEIIPLIDLKIVYLTDDPVRLKRKWKRDIDYRKKYNPKYLCNRYFRTQFLKAKAVYLSQLEICDIAVDTTNSCIWLTEKIEKLLEN